MHSSSFLKHSRRHLLHILAATALTITIMPVLAQQTAETVAQQVTPDQQKINRLLQLIDQRLNLASDVAKSKWNSNAIIEDPEREKQILASIRTKASSMGVTNLALIEVFFKNQFEASKIIQARLIMHWHSVYPADFKFADAPNLTETIRPKLDQLTPELIIALQEVEPLMAQPALHAYLINQSKKLIRDDVNGEVRHEALMTFDSE